MAYLISLGVGVLAGLLYGLLNVRSPAPPAIALIGLLGILLGEQAVPLARRLVAGKPPAALLRGEGVSHPIPSRSDARPTDPA